MNPVLTIDLEAIAANWRNLRHTHGAPTACVVKADAYGLGAAEVAPYLYDAGARHFFVAQLSEAVALRATLPHAFLAVLNGFAEAQADIYEAYALRPVLGSLHEIAAYQRHAARRGRALPALLHLDTGMHRLGLSAAEQAEMAGDPRHFDGIAWDYVMTHLVSAELAADPLNALQLSRFQAARAWLPAIPASVANSSGIFLGPAFRSDLARPGAALYGVNPTPGLANPMRPVLRLTAPVLQVRDVAAGESVGYNGIWVAQRPTRVATVALGYADGYHRAASNATTSSGTACSGAAAVAGPRFDGARLPLIGRVSMDLTTFDATDHPTLAPGDHLELIGPAIPPDEVAGWTGSNGYEVLTSLRHRAVRRYAAL